MSEFESDRDPTWGTVSADDFNAMAARAKKAEAEIARLKGDLSGARRENAAIKTRAEKAEALLREAQDGWAEGHRCAPALMTARRAARAVAVAVADVTARLVAQERAEMAEAARVEACRRATDTSIGCAIALCKERDEAVIRAEKLLEIIARAVRAIEDVGGPWLSDSEGLIGCIFCSSPDHAVTCPWRELQKAAAS